MKILALETTTAGGSVAALDDERLLAEAALADGQRSAQSLAPVIEQLWKTVDWAAVDVELVALPVGPGSFTGLRVGVTTAKTLAYATGAEVLGVNTLSVIAQQSSAEVQQVTAILNAYRGQLFVGRYRRDDKAIMRPVDETTIVDIDPWLAELADGETLIGPGVEKARERTPAHVAVVDEQLWAPTAVVVGRLAWMEYQAGRRETLWSLAPNYYRKSAAEEKADAIAAAKSVAK